MIPSSVFSKGRNLSAAANFCYAVKSENSDNSNNSDDSNDFVTILIRIEANEAG